LTSCLAPDFAHICLRSALYIPLRQNYSDALIPYVRTERDPSATPQPSKAKFAPSTEGCLWKTWAREPRSSACLEYSDCWRLTSPPSVGTALCKFLYSPFCRVKQNRQVKLSNQIWPSHGPKTGFQEIRSPLQLRRDWYSLS